MPLSTDAFAKIKRELEKQLESIDEQLTTLEALEPNDEIRTKINGLNIQKKALTDTIELIDDLLDGFKTADQVFEHLKPILPVFKQLIADYGEAAMPIFRDFYAAIVGLNALVSVPREELYAQEAAELKKYFDALVAAGFSEDRAIKIVAHRGAPGDLTAWLGQFFRFNFEVEMT